MKKNQEADAAQARAEHVAALEAEREGYERRGLNDRVKQVNDQIKHFGSKPSGRTAPDATDSTDGTPAKKTAAKKTAAAPKAATSTADAGA